MRNLSLPALMVLALTACDSADVTRQSPVVPDPSGQIPTGQNPSGESGNTAQSSITVPDQPGETWTSLPNINFNGQYETTARPDLGVSDTGSTGVTDAVSSEADAGEVTASASDPAAGAADSSDSRVADSPIVIGGPTPPNQQITPGTLTAGDYDDHLNPFLYQDYASDYLQRRGQAVDVPRLDFNKRIQINVTNMGGQPYPDARVEVAGSISLDTGADGTTSLYANLDSLQDNFNLQITAPDGTSVQQSINLQKALDAGEINAILAAANETQSTTSASMPVDLMFVIDTTGSMADELNFLQTELSDIISAVSLQQADIKVGLVFYRDYGDRYVVRAHEFSENINAVQLNLNQESARGGGDYPEAMDQALQAALGADWRTNSRKVMFLVADAPPHSDRMRATWNAAAEARLKNIHMVPVAASGVAEDAEYIMRSTAALTNSRYLFLTDDSGYGLSHAQPDVDCYVVTSLRKAMIRALNSLVTGQRVEPSANDIIRQVGNYNEGVCSQTDQPDTPRSIETSVLIERQFPLNGTFTESRTQIISDQDSFVEELARYGEVSVTADFESGQVLMVNMGPRLTGGFSIEITDAEEFDDHVNVNVTLVEPGSNCIVTQALTNPFSFFYIPTQKEIRTTEVTVSEACSP